MSDIDPTAAAHRRAVELEDWDRVRELEAELIEPTENTERPEDGPQPPPDPGPDLPRGRRARGVSGFTAASVLEIARSEIGVVEARGRSTKYGKWYGLNGQAWCAMFTSWCFAQLGAPRNGMTFTAWTPGIYAAAKAAGRWHHSPRSGDLVLFSFKTPSSRRPLGIGHVGLVETVGESGVITTIEGNTNAAGSGSGGRVMRKNRRTKIAGYARPAYEIEATPKLGDRLLKLRTPHMRGEDVLEWQRDFLVPWRRRAGGPQVIVPAGNFLTLTAGETKQFQRALGVGDDGEVGPITLEAARAWRARQ